MTYNVECQVKYLVILLLAGVLVACRPADVAQGSAQVTLEFFSGRETPVWSLSRADTRRLAELLANLAQGNQPVPPGKLGYRGFAVKLPDAGGATCHTLWVFKSFLECEAGSGSTLLSDPDRQVEQLLVASARDHLPSDLYATLRKQTEASP